MALSDRLYQSERHGHQLKSDAFAQRLWHGYRLTDEEMRQIDKLMGRAMLDQRFCNRLLQQRDKSVFREYNLTPETQHWLGSIEACTLIEFAQAIAADTTG